MRNKFAFYNAGHPSHKRTTMQCPTGDRCPAVVKKLDVAWSIESRSRDRHAGSVGAGRVHARWTKPTGNTAGCAGRQAGCAGRQAGCAGRQAGCAGRQAGCAGTQASCAGTRPAAPAHCHSRLRRHVVPAHMAPARAGCAGTRAGMHRHTFFCTAGVPAHVGPSSTHPETTQPPNQCMGCFLYPN